MEHSSGSRPPTRLSGLAAALLGAVLIVLASVTLGLAYNHLSPTGIPVFPRPQPEGQAALPMPAGVKPVSLASAYADFRGKAALFLDARTAEEFARGHVPGAVSVPAKELPQRVPEVAEQIDAAPRVVVYCRGIDCSDAVDLAEQLASMMKKPMYVFEGGWDEWVRANYPTEQGADQ